MDPPDIDSVPTPRAYATAQMANVDAAVRDLQHPTRIGPYEILELIGEGGMGSVYKAEQRDPIQRIVAIKIIKLGMDTRQVIARFESERQALALMDHPNLARVLEAGATETGRPYFVMEYVAGEPITTFADRQKLTLRQRLELFMQACDAVQHAHQKAIIHRDLKPSNILVTLQDSKPCVKVIDFGVAKAISQRLTEKTLVTESGQLLGTPEYMAPEQAESAIADIDTRTDVYSLGVVLYELLSGALPFDPSTLRSAGYNEIQRIIRDSEPPRPSTKLSRMGKDAEVVAEQRQTPLESLAQQLKSELEWIPLKAMRKERSQRYQTATELREDIDNYLANRPLRAGPESSAYRLRKFLRRNQTGVAASAAMVFLLIAGITATSWQAIRATRAERAIRDEQTRTLEQKNRAEDAQAATEQVNQFLVGMLRSVDPKKAQGKPVLVRDVLDEASAQVGPALSSQPRVEAKVRIALGRTYSALGFYDQAEPHLLAAKAIYQQLGGDDDINTIKAQGELAGLRMDQGRLDEALALHRNSLQRLRRVLGNDHRDTLQCLNEVAVVLLMLDKPADAEPLLRESLERAKAVLGPESPQVLKTTGNLGQVLKELGRYDQAEPLLREAYDSSCRIRGLEHPDTLGDATQLADVLRYTGHLAEAETLMRQALEGLRKAYGPDHIRTIGAERGLAIIFSRQRRHDDSIAMWRDALERLRRTRGNNDRETLLTVKGAANELTWAGKPADAEPLFWEALAGFKKTLGPESALTLAVTDSLAYTLSREEKWAQALPLWEDLFKRVRAPGKIEIDSRERAAHMVGYGICLAKLHKYDDAMQPLTEARAALAQTRDRKSLAMKEVLTSLARCANATNRPDEAVRWSAELAALTPTTTTTTAPKTEQASR